MNNSNLKSKVCAIIPFYNEKDFLLDVVNQTLNFVDFIIAVDDGSNDNSSDSIRNIDKVILITLDRNLGKGFALQKGFDETINKGFEIILTIDADNQHNPEFIPGLIGLLNKYDVVIGNRLNDKKLMPIQRILSNTITSFLLTVKTGQRILDSQCGFRAYKSKVLQSVKTKFCGYEAESEMIVLAARNNFKIGFFNVPTIYGNEKSKMNPFKAIIGFIKVLFI